ncbi:DUF6310 domain-containing protein [Corallococcus sp. bb12-1]|uniref:DUF6310 domain-containing protein n=1 Tax=Corallococcus sp. bb12-1 TaxID=2996784 RepID=UPI0022700D48|nr:DUF6310 domain-containing protein [Corallococcus sp. bb12-1]MCY1045376.1 DUF6310 domain-containing protein [Corallococcus sp. bb12-1]
MRSRACIGLLLFLSACATSTPTPSARGARSQRMANLQRAAALPWTDGGQCVVREASQPWPVLVERCYQALDHDQIEFHDTAGRCAVASAGAGAMGVGLCVLVAPELVVGAVIVLGVVVVAVAIKEELEAYELRHASPDECADEFPPNRYPGMDVLVGGVRFDALQVGVRKLWEIKREVEQLRKERKTAMACGYEFVIGVSTEAHRDALLQENQSLNVVVTGCRR